MSASQESSPLVTLAERVGIASEYYDIGGTLHVASDDTKRAILSAMGFRVDSPEDLAKALQDWEEAPWRRPCEPVLVVREGASETVALCCLALEDGKERSAVVRWTIADESGQPARSGEAGPGLSADDVRFVDGQRRVRLGCRLPGDLPIGYYSVTIQASGLIDGSSGTLRLIVAPQQCYLPPALADHRRIWGIALQLYALASNRNWGCGDFTDLSAVVEWAGTSLGAGLIGLNPLHALRNSAPHHTSPYSPVTRLFLNELYIDLERLPEFWASPEAQRQFQAPEFQAKLKALRESRRVDYDAIAAAKRTLLDLAYRQFLKEHYAGNEPDLEPKTARAKLLERFIRAEGEPLELYATFQALEEERRLIQPKATSWRDWPAQFQSPSPAVREYGKRHRKRLRFFQYIQWVASEQLGDNRRRSEQAGMTIGLYNDLALGAERFGAESWMYQSVLSLDADCGAPPDSLGPQGQNWGLPPVNPLALRAGGYELIIRLLRNNLRFGGAIRLDHVMALCRLFWIPRGKPAAEGTYVHYPFEDLLAIVALESVRAKTLVIGEDLGTVPDWVREELAKARVLSYRVFYFERHGDGTCKAPNEYPEQSLAVVGTHDLPTLTGFWSGEDLQVRSGLGALGDDDAKRRAWEDRRRDKERMLEALAREGLLPEGLSVDPDAVPAMTPALCQAIHIYLARSTSAVVLANVEDGLEELSQTNLPGTIDAHPNWNRKYAVPVETLPAEPRLRDLASVLRSTRSLG